MSAAQTLCLLALMLAPPAPARVYRVSLEVAPSGPSRCAPPPWASTGFREMEWNLAYLGALPRPAIQQARVHWLLQLVRAKRLDGDGDWRWDFGLLDRFLDLLAQNGLRPGFEIMGSPIVVNDEDDVGSAGATPQRPRRHNARPLFVDVRDQEELWERLVRETVVHCAERYGREAVRLWRFETWNEPDLAMYNQFNWTVDGYMAYFGATVRGVQAAAQSLGVRLRLGGPAGIFKARGKHPICWHVLEYCNRMAARNQSCGLDFITFHRKGDGTSGGVVDGTLQLLAQFSRLFPHLGHLPFANDEADPLTGWWRRKAWRGDRRYAGMVVNVLADLQERWAADDRLPPLELLGNDNGFLETTQQHFQQRTLLASFSEVSTGALYMFRKPVMTAMAMLGFATGTALPVLRRTKAPLRLSVLAADRGDGAVVSVLVAFNNETQPAGSSPPIACVRLRVRKKPSAGGGLVLVRVSSLVGDPMRTWRRAGAPSRPPPELRQNMRREEVPRVEQSRTVNQSAGETAISVEFNVTLGTISLVQLFVHTEKTPLEVVNLRAMNVTYNEVLLLWSDGFSQSSHVASYQVSFRPRGSRQLFAVISDSSVSQPGGEPKGEPWTLFPTFHYAPLSPASRNVAGGELTRGDYRVVAVDVWGRLGPPAHLRYPI